jgi:cytochrome c biogenesis protein CcdA/thiol-disulfide isomerase/thioredoxin
MTFFVLAYLAGVLTIATPCILPILPFVLARADQPFRQGGLPMLTGLAIAFAAAASLAAVAGDWAVAASDYGRAVALALMALFGLAMLLPSLAVRLTGPLVSLGSSLSGRAGRRRSTTTASSMLLGVATGLVWAPCAGPVLGLILTGAALRGPSVETFLLLLAYAAGAATSLAAGMLLGRHLLALVGRSAGWGEGLRRALGAAVVAGAVAISLGLDAGLLTRLSAAGTNLVEQRLVTAAQAATPAPALSGPLGSLLRARQWLNTAPLQSTDLRGKVVLVNFWTYSCINCLRTLPHVRAWAEAYKDRGLMVVGVHTPEFAFEKDVGNVAKAAASLGVSYPVAIDNDFAIWRAFGNRGWPALYFIDAEGRIRHHALGEGGWDESERVIQQLLTEADGVPVAGGGAAIDGRGALAAADLGNLRSGETYIGYAHATGFASPGGIRTDVPSVYRPASALPLGRWSLRGTWTVGSEFASLDAGSGSISHRFHARDLHLVLGSDRPVRFRITIDGAPPRADHGADVDADGWGTVRDNRLYQLVRQRRPVEDRTFEIEFLDPGVHAYAFTFG